MKYKAVFFDFDGTLMDTSAGIKQCGKDSLAAIGLTASPDADWDSFIGPPLEQCFRVTHGITDKAKIEALCEIYRQLYYSEGLHQAVFYDGIVELLRELKRRGYKVGCASMKHDDLVRKMLDYFGVSQYFDVVLGLDVEQKFSKADLLCQGCSLLGIKTSEAVMVGDTVFDAEGAEKAGCAMIKVDWGFGFKKGEEGTVSSALQILSLV